VEIDAAAVELYGLASEQFVAARNQLAKAVRDRGDEAAAAAIVALRKPTIAAQYRALDPAKHERAKQMRCHRQKRGQRQIRMFGKRLAIALERWSYGGDHGVVESRVSRSTVFAMQCRLHQAMKIALGVVTRPAGVLRRSAGVCRTHARHRCPCGQSRLWH
jgi:hypothetical protein